MGVAGAGCGQVYVCLCESEEVVCNGSHNILKAYARHGHGGRVCLVSVLQVAEE